MNIPGGLYLVVHSQLPTRKKVGSVIVGGSERTETLFRTLGELRQALRLEGAGADGGRHQSRNRRADGGVRRAWPEHGDDVHTEWREPSLLIGLRPCHSLRKGYSRLRLINKK